MDCCSVPEDGLDDWHFKRISTFCQLPSLLTVRTTDLRRVKREVASNDEKSVFQFKCIHYSDLHGGGILRICNMVCKHRCGFYAASTRSINPACPLLTNGLSYDRHVFEPYVDKPFESIALQRCNRGCFLKALDDVYLEHHIYSSIGHNCSFRCGSVQSCNLVLNGYLLVCRHYVWVQYPMSAVLAVTE